MCCLSKLYGNKWRVTLLCVILISYTVIFSQFFTQWDFHYHTNKIPGLWDLGKISDNGDVIS